MAGVASTSSTSTVALVQTDRGTGEVRRDITDSRTDWSLGQSFGHGLHLGLGGLASVLRPEVCSRL